MRKTILLGILILAALCLSACSTYENDDGVIIRQSNGWFGSTPQHAPMGGDDLNS